MSTKPIIKRKKSTMILAWLAPIVAIIISYSMLENYFEQKGNIITIYTQDIKGLNVAKSHIQFQGLKIGKLLSMSIDKKDLKRFKITAQIYKEFNYFIREGSKFWIVSPTINLNKIENLETVLTGNYIEVSPATKDIKKLKKLSIKKVFTTQETKPNKEGKTVTLLSQNGDITKNTKITYKSITVGEILNKKLLETNKLSYQILIYKKYIHLVNDKTLFYKIDPVDLEISPTKLSLKIASINNLLSNSISFINDLTIKDKNTNYLYNNKEDLYFSDKIIILNINNNQNISNIYYNNEIVAKVIKSKYNEKINTEELYIKFKNRYFYLLKTDPNFYLLENKLDIESFNLKNILSGAKIILTNNYLQKTDIKNSYNVKIYDKNQNLKGIDLTFLSDLVSKNEKILYKNIEIGFIKKVYLDNDGKKAIGFIHKQYQHFINNSTQFYKLQDLNVDISNTGLNMSIGSFKQIYKGGISFITKDKKENKNNRKFSIYQNLKAIEKENKNDTHFNITLNLADGYNLKKTSSLFYKNIEIGKIENIKLNANIKATLLIDKKYKKLFNLKSKIYMEGIKISLNGVKNLSSTVLGDKLHLVTNTLDNGFKSVYKIDSINPINTKYKDGLRVIVTHINGKNISLNAPIYYQYFQIGSIENIELNTKTNKIDITLFINKQYSKYIKNNSKFKYTDIIDIEFGLMASKIKIGNFESLIKGGFSVSSPKEFKNYASNGNIFKLNIDNEN
ncbi:MAG: MCE family protein [Arcobacteraceae bacterium]|nr:MCE family protein [Arcobacteraceae bacterium]